MKEVTEWNGKPRWMWCWDNNEHDRYKEYVLYVLTDEQMKECGAYYPVCTYGLNYTHCAEIEEDRTRQMTNQELSWWLRDCPEEHREWKHCTGTTIYNNHEYQETESFICVTGVLIRSNGGEWKLPLMEVEK